MAATNFTTLLSNEKVVWSRDVWAAARNASFVMQFAGKGSNSMIQRITELTKTEKGTKAIITLVTDLIGDGRRGDDAMEDNEEAINAYDTEIVIDQLRNANRTTGRFADQKSVINFRNTSKDVLAYWMADRIDQLAFQTLAGWGFNLNPNGSARATTTFANLEFYTDMVATPNTFAQTAARQVTWKGIAHGGLDETGATNIALVNPSWNMLVELKAFAKDNYIRGIKGPGNAEYFHVFMTPQGLAKLKQDPEFKKNLESAGPRTSGNPLFSGSVMTQDGLIIHEFRHVPNTSGLTATNKWAADGNTDGQACIFAGAQALGMADIGLPYWDEDEFDYNNQKGISVGKMFGFQKPQFHSIISGSAQTFGTVRCNTATMMCSGYGTA